MKLYSYIFSLFVLAGALVACSDDDLTQLTESATTPPELSLSETAFDLEMGRAAEEALTFSWNALELNVNTPVRYILELALAGTNFGEVKTLMSSGDTSFTLTVAQLNAQAISLGIGPEEEGSLEARVIARLGTTAAGNLVSSVKELSVIPYAASLDLSTTWGIVGDATPNGWDGPDVPFWKTDKDNVLVAYTALVEGEIKFREDNSWDNDYGGADGVLEPGGANIAVAEGQYKITVNFEELTYTLEKFSLGVVGDAAPNSWDGPDIELTYDPTSNKFRALAELSEGEIKFRLNNQWSVDWGGSDGELVSGGDNIPVEAGTYLISVDLDNETYEIEPVTNVWGVVGDATPNGWDGPDVVLHIDYTSDYASGEGVWYAENVSLTEGNIKFRANNDWAIDYGSDNADGQLDQGGSDIPIESAGSYDIVLDLGEMTYSLEKR